MVTVAVVTVRWPYEVMADAGEADASNELEELLLGIELPTPLQPILGSRAWASFAAAVGQMFLIGGARPHPWICLHL